MVVVGSVPRKPEITILALFMGTLRGAMEGQGERHLNLFPCHKRASLHSVCLCESFEGTIFELATSWRGGDFKSAVGRRHLSVPH